MKVLQAKNENSKVNLEPKSPKKNKISTNGSDPPKNETGNLTEKCSGRKMPEKISRSSASPSKTPPKKVTLNSSQRASETKNKKELSTKRPKTGLKCHHCHFSCIKKLELKLHLKSKHKNASNDVTNGNLNQISRHNTLAGLKCGSCKFCAKNRKDLRDHFRTKHSSDEENFPEYGPPDVKKSCQFCSSRFGCIKELNNHVRTSHSDRLKYKCDRCNFGSNFHAGLAYHVKTKHVDGVIGVFKSNFVVDEIFDEKSSSIEDERASVKTTTLKCRLCPFVGKTSLQLERHTKLKHSNSDVSENSFVHDEVIDADLAAIETTKKSRKCTKKNSETSQLHDDTNDTKTVAKKFKCKSCNYDAKTRSTLNCHFRRIHLGIRDQTCQYCSYKAGNKSDLTKHINGVHLKKKDFKCKNCDYSCAMSSTLVQHVRAVHLKIKNHVCPGCDYKTSFGGDLMKHIRSKHSESSVAILKKLKQWKIKKKRDPNNAANKIQEMPNLGIIVGPPVLMKAENELICEFCDFKCRFKKSFLKHLKTKHRDRDSTPAGENGLKTILLEDENSKNTIFCLHCDFRTKTVPVFEKHVAAKHPQIEKEKFHSKICPHCKYRAKDKTDLADHISESHPKLVKNLLRKMKVEFTGGHKKSNAISNDFKCPTCSFKASKFNLVVKHVRKSHQKASGDLLRQLRMMKRFACSECSLKSRFKVNISRHMSKLHPGLRAKVVVIDSTAIKFQDIVKNGKIFNDQKSIHKSEPENEVKLKNVVKEKSKKIVKAEENFEADPTLFKIQLSCTKCSFVAKNHPDLILHFDKAHLKRGSDRRCPHCNYRTTLSVLLNSHVVTSHSKNVKSSTASLNVRQLFM